MTAGTGKQPEPLPRYKDTGPRHLSLALGSFIEVVDSQTQAESPRFISVRGLADHRSRNHLFVGPHPNQTWSDSMLTSDRKVGSPKVAGSPLPSAGAGLTSVRTSGSIPCCQIQEPRSIQAWFFAACTVSLVVLTWAIPSQFARTAPTEDLRT